MDSNLRKKYVRNFSFSERDRQLFNMGQKKFLRTVYSKGHVALIVSRKLANESVKALHESLSKLDIFGVVPKLDESIVGDLWLFLEYRDQQSAKEFFNSVKPKRAKASDY